MPNNKMRRSESTVVPNESAINSPLARFGRAKKRINQIFAEAHKYLKESRLYLIECDISERSNIDSRKDLKQVCYESIAVKGIGGGGTGLGLRISLFYHVTLGIRWELSFYRMRIEKSAKGHFETLFY